MKRKTRFIIGLILILIITLGFLIRFYRISCYPPLLWDEAALGYNAYSILKTARDEYGKLLPMVFKSFGDYKPGFYVYLSMPFVVIFGLNELSVRLPAIILGSLSPLFLFFLVKEIFKDRKLALLSAAVFSFLPWQIHFSRGAWEANLMVSFLILASYFFFKGKSLEIKNVFWGLLFSLLGLWTYQAAKMMVPLILLGVFVFRLQSGLAFLKKIRPKKEFLGIGIIVILMGLWFLQTFSGSAKNRLRVMGLFSYHRPAEETARLLAEDDLEATNFRFLVFHGEWLHFLRGSLTRYFNHFSPRFLAFEGDWSNLRQSAPYFGVIGHLNLGFFFLGLAIFLSKKRKGPENFFLYWLIISPLPAAFSRDIISGVRALAMSVPLAVLISYFLKTVLELRKGIVKQFLLAFLIFGILADFFYWSDLYFNHLVKKAPKDWLYGYKEAVESVIDYQHNNPGQPVLMTDFYGQPYIYYLFFSKYSPQKYQQEARLVENKFGDVGRIERIGNVTFKSIDWYANTGQSGRLLVFSHDEILRSGFRQEEIPLGLEPKGLINNQATFYVYEE